MKIFLQLYLFEAHYFLTFQKGNEEMSGLLGMDLQ